MTKTGKKEMHKNTSHTFTSCATTDLPIRYILKEKEIKDSLKTYTLTINVQSPNSYAMGWISTMSYNVPQQ